MALKDQKAIKKTELTRQRIGIQLKRLRVYFDKTAKEFADMIGIDVTALSKYESGRLSNPGIDFFIKVKIKFGVLPDYFLLNISPKTHLDISKENKISTYKFVWLPLDRKEFYRKEITKDFNKALSIWANRPFDEIYDTDSGESGKFLDSD